MQLIECVREINYCQGKITSKQLVDLVKGKSVKSSTCEVTWFRNTKES